MSTVAAAAEQAATNIALVSTATEEMNSTTHNIVEFTKKAQKKTKTAVCEADSASVKVDELGKTAIEIGKVTETIIEISEQKNPLALTTTIEAARAGEAGKGFAVIAYEIKELARQTAGATGEIKNRIGSIQSFTEATVGQIQQFTQVIGEINNIVSSIVTAVDAHSATTSEIATNISQAFIGIQEFTENISQEPLVSNTVVQDISKVRLSADSIFKVSAQVKLNALELTQMAKQLKELVRHFKV